MFKVLEVRNSVALMGYVIYSSEHSTTVSHIRDGIAHLTANSYPKIYSSIKSAEKAIKSIKEVMPHSK